MKYFVFLVLLGVGVVQPATDIEVSGDDRSTGRKELSVCPEHQEIVMELMASNGCSAEDRVTLSGIADQFTDFLLANRRKLKLEKKKQMKKKPRRSRRAPDCTYECTPSCRIVCSQNCSYSCDPDDGYYGCDGFDEFDDYEDCHGQ